MWQFVGYESTRRLGRNVWAWVRIVCVRNVHGYETTGKLYTPGWREALWELCLAQEHNCLVYVGKLCNAPWSLHSLLHMVNLYCGMCHLIWVSLKWDLAANKSKVQFKYRLSFLVIIFQDSALIWFWSYILPEVSEQRLQALRKRAPAIRSKDVTYRVCRYWSVIYPGFPVSPLW